MLRTASLLPLHRAFDAGLRRRAFPPDAASLLPGLLAATRTGLTPAGDDELMNQRSTTYMANLQVLLGVRKIEVKGWRLLRNLRCSTNRITNMVKAVLVLHHALS